ncbi:uncharacterized protein LOC110931682 [Helianthus annuus]|uniref:uncharacterized protein LOC110931682 n=1 Tax=Helianthus annuus TaxID=4232 RepID=UPI000B9034BD|nr:uncharacterized protein LOC110931682 [Helianthus annuus]
MTGIPRNIAEHELRIPPDIKPVVQKKRSLAPERSLAACQEVENLVSAGILREVKYQSWVANPIMVRKPDNSWRMCIDFKDLNKACPKDCYPLPEIDLKVDSLTGYPFKCFLDAYKGYHQILMKEEDEEKTAFHTDKGIFCYREMPFGLKNAGATYQRLVDKAFLSQIGRNMETEEAEGAFNQMKQHLASLPDIAAPETGELISVYLSVAEEAISAVLTIERDKVQTTNNEAEYEALIAGLRLAKEMKVQKLKVFTDSLLVSSQVNDSYVAKEPNMKRYREKSKELMKTFQECNIKQIPRSQNKKADALSKLASLTFAHLTKKVLVEVLKAPSIDELEVQDVVTEEEPNWMTPIKKFLKNGELPRDQIEAERVKIKARQYVLQGETLYKKGYLAPLLRCVGPEQREYLIKEIHEGICEAHFGARSVVAQLMNLGYFWLSMHQDTSEQLRKCDACQIHALIPKSPKHDLVLITSAWPFYKWGMDIVGPFPPRKGGVKFLLVAIDYFTKWPEVKPLAKITSKQVIDFVWENIICRYGLPGVLVTDNGKQFAKKPFSVWCKEYRINQVFSSVAYPQSNSQVERTNRSIVEGIKTRLGRYESNWLEELPGVLWAIRTTEKTSHKRTPYSLVFGSEAIIPAEIGVVFEIVLIDCFEEFWLRNLKIGRLKLLGKSGK